MYSFNLLHKKQNLSLPRNDVKITTKQETSPNYFYRQFSVNSEIYKDNLWISSDSLQGDFVAENRVLLDRSYTNSISKFEKLHKGERLILRNLIYRVSVEVKVKAKLGPGLLLLDRDIGNMPFHILLRRWRKTKRKQPPRPEPKPTPDLSNFVFLIQKLF